MTSSCAVDTPTRLHRVILLALHGLVFSLAYGACDGAAQRAQVTHHWAALWDVPWPFVPWMIVPYAASVPLLALGFFALRDRQSLHLYSHRLLMTTAIGCLVMAIWPLRYPGERPWPTEAPWSVAFDLLHRLDGPYNQWPSLHAAYAVVMGSVSKGAISSTGWRAAFLAWLAAWAASTVLIGQHHVLDLIGGIGLGAIVCALVPMRHAPPAVALHYTAGTLLALVWAWTVGPWWLWAWLAICTAAVAQAYRSGHADFLHKREGQFPPWVWMLYGPYLLGYVLTWHGVRWRERGHAPVEEVVPGLWMGRRLSAEEARIHLPADCSVIDLANELGETPALRGARYHAEPCLDLLPMPPSVLQRVLAHIGHETAQGRAVYVHCAMGYSRSRQVVQAHLEQRRPP